MANELSYRPDKLKLRQRLHSYETGGKNTFISGEFQTFTAAVGHNAVRILPPTWQNAAHYGYDIYVHYQVGPDKGSFLCPQKAQRHACPICEERQRAFDEGDKDYAKTLYPNYSVLVWMVDRNKASEGVKAWAMPKTIDKELISQQIDPITGEVLEDIVDFNAGYDVNFFREGTGLQTKYNRFTVGRKPSLAGPEQVLTFIKSHPLPTILMWASYDDINRAFKGDYGKPEEEQGEDKIEEFSTAPAYSDYRESKIHEEPERPAEESDKKAEIKPKPGLTIKQKEVVKEVTKDFVDSLTGDSLLNWIVNNGYEEKLSLTEDDTEETIKSRLKEIIFGKETSSAEADKISKLRDRLNKFKS